MYEGINRDAKDPSRLTEFAKGANPNCASKSSKPDDDTWQLGFELAEKLEKMHEWDTCTAMVLLCRGILGPRPTPPMVIIVADPADLTRGAISEGTVKLDEISYDIQYNFAFGDGTTDWFNCNVFTAAACQSDARLKEKFPPNADRRLFFPSDEKFCDVNLAEAIQEQKLRLLKKHERRTASLDKDPAPDCNTCRNLLDVMLGRMFKEFSTDPIGFKPNESVLSSLADGACISNEQLQQIETEANARAQELETQWGTTQPSIRTLRRGSFVQYILDADGVKDRMDNFNLQSLSGSNMTKLETRKGPRSAPSAHSAVKEEEGVENSSNRDWEANSTNMEQHLDEQETTATAFRQHDILEDEEDAASIDARLTSRAMTKESTVQKLRLKYGECYSDTKSNCLKSAYRDYFHGTVAESDIFEGSEPAPRPVAKDASKAPKSKSKKTKKKSLGKARTARTAGKAIELERDSSNRRTAVIYAEGTPESHADFKIGLVNVKASNRTVLVVQPLCTPKQVMHWSEAPPRTAFETCGSEVKIKNCVVSGALVATQTLCGKYLEPGYMLFDDKHARALAKTRMTNYTWTDHSDSDRSLL
jgi:hypothetical protein